MWLPALQIFRFTGNPMTGKKNVRGDRRSRFPWAVVTPQAVEIIQLAGELELDTDPKEESESESEEDAEKCLLNESSALGALILLGIEMLREHQKVDNYC